MLMQTKEALLVLRKKMSSKLISLDEFAIRASEIYINRNLPLRAEPLLSLIKSPGALDSALRAKYLKLKNNLVLSNRQAKKLCSLNMIVRNEEKNIAEALECVDIHIDEIVICDTGSEDNTVRIAEMFGAKIIRSEWKSDFSLARNTAIEHSSCPRIFWMDADDRIDSQNMVKIKTLLNSSANVAFLLNIQNRLPNGMSAEFMQVRIFPNMKDVRFEQKIHEQIMPSLSRVGIKYSIKPEIKIYHLGYQDKNLKQMKAKRNLPIIKSELEFKKDDPTLLMNLGDAEICSGSENNALNAYRSIVSNVENFNRNRDVYIQASLNMASILIKKNRYDIAHSIITSLLELDPNIKEGHFLIGKIDMRNNQLESAKMHFVNAITLPKINRMTATNTVQIRAESAYSIVEILVKQRKYTEALKVISSAITEFPGAYSFYNIAGNIAITMEDYSNAVDFFKTALEITGGKNSEAMNGIREIQKRLNSYTAVS